MEIINYTETFKDELICFIRKCYEAIEKQLDLSTHDIDLLNINQVYFQNGGSFFLAVEDNVIIATIAIKIIIMNNKTIGEVKRFYVLPQLKNSGIGTQLLEYIYEYAKSKGVNYLRGTTSKKLTDAISLFKYLNAHEIPQYRYSHADLFFEKEIIENSCDEDYTKFATEISKSFKKFEKYNKKTLILNPVENYPLSEFLVPCSSNIHGLYNTDSVRNDIEKQNSKIQFSGREIVLTDINKIYEKWSKLIGAEALTMRLLSGLHAHIILFMAITNIGDRVLLLPEVAGGHMATKAILERLGLVVEEFPVDIKNRKIDIEKSLTIIDEFDPKVIFVDRSEGLIYEDFSWINNIDKKIIKIYDASQYLTNIISKDYFNPFDMGFDIILSTMHKNLPGPQRALICCKKVDNTWIQLKSGISTYVSNMHFHSIYSAGLLLKDLKSLKNLSNNMLNNTILLDEALKRNGINTVQRSTDVLNPTTHHIWIELKNKEIAYEWYKKLESIGILTNYRKLPYNIGYGLRLGLSAATYRGLSETEIPILANIIADCVFEKVKKDELISRLKNILESIDSKND